eukprot:scaffold61078_cov17-Tisochrysis_lutea.AAC.1
MPARSWHERLREGAGQETRACLSETRKALVGVDQCRGCWQGCMDPLTVVALPFDVPWQPQPLHAPA